MQWEQWCCVVKGFKPKRRNVSVVNMWCIMASKQSSSEVVSLQLLTVVNYICDHFYLLFCFPVAGWDLEARSTALVLPLLWYLKAQCFQLLSVPELPWDTGLDLDFPPLMIKAPASHCFLPDAQQKWIHWEICRNSPTFVWNLHTGRQRACCSWSVAVLASKHHSPLSAPWFITVIFRVASDSNRQNVLRY